MVQATSDWSRFSPRLSPICRRFEIVAQKCVCVLATKTSMTVMNELAAHLTDKQDMLCQVLKEVDLFDRQMACCGVL